ADQLPLLRRQKRWQRLARLRYDADGARGQHPEVPALTARVGLIGQPVQHSISPIFQQAAFDALKIDARYEAWETSAAALPERIAALRRHDFLGANVTVPHKETAAALIDQAD